MSKKISSFSASVAGLLMLALALTVLSVFNHPIEKLPSSPAAKIIVPKIIPAKLDPSRAELPLRLVIPEIGVNAAVEDIGLTPSGVMAMTTSLVNVAWYNLGQRPGEEGSAVIAGHFGGTSRVAVFNNLHKLKKRDILFVQGATSTTTFVVRESRNYNPAADASSIFQSNDGGAHLNLITCEGVWSKATKSYTQRLVVFTDKL